MTAETRIDPQHQEGAAAEPFWRMPLDALLASLGTGTEGLTQAEAAAGLQRYGPNLLRPREMVLRPRRWDITFIRDFMLVFGLLSSVFDYATFALLMWVLHAGAAEFRTGWFMESVASASLIVLVIRARRLFYRAHG